MRAKEYDNINAYNIKCLSKKQIFKFGASEETCFYIPS